MNSSLSPNVSLGRLWYDSFSCCCVICNFFFKSISFDRVELVSDITKTVLLTADIGTKLNGTVDTWSNLFM